MEQNQGQLGTGHSTAWWIRELFGHTRRTLKRLVIDMPLRADYDNVEERKTLREGFLELTRLEEFVSVRDELYLSVENEDAPVWTLWPELRGLALYNPYTEPIFWRRIASMGKLESVVLTRPDGIRDSDCCIKTELLFNAKTDHVVKVVLANAHELEWLPNTRTWLAADPAGRVRVGLHDVPWDGHDDVIEVCQEHVKMAAVGGTIWILDSHYPSLDGVELGG